MVVRESPDAMAIWRMLTPPASASRTSWSRSAPDSSLRRFQSASRAATSGVTGPSRTWPCRSRRSRHGGAWGGTPPPLAGPNEVAGARYAGRLAEGHGVADLRIGGLVRARGAGLGRLVDRLAGDAGGQRGDAADGELLARVAAVRLNDVTQLAGGEPAAEADLDEAGADAVAGHDADDAAFAAVLEGVVEAYGAASGRALEDRGKSGGLCRHVYNYTCAGVDTQEGSGK